MGLAPVTGGKIGARLLVTGFRPGPGGIGRVMVNLINGFARAGLDVHLLVGPGDFPALASDLAGVPVHRLDMKGGGQAVEGLRSFLRELSPQAVLSNRDDASTMLVAAMASMPVRPRLVLRIGIHAPEKLRWRNPISRWRRRRELISTYRGADLLIGNSEGVCQGLSELLGVTAPPISTIYNPLDVDRARRLAEESPDHPWFLGGGGRLLVSVGRLVRMKDQTTMLRAFARLPGDFRLVVFGEGRQRPRLQALAEKLGVAGRFDLPGYADNPFPYLERADLFVLSSRFEGSPNALLESLAVGTPAVSTDCPSGPREILGEGCYGMLVPVGDYRKLADAILDTLDRPPSDTLLEEAVQRFDLGHAVQQYAEALHLQVGGTPARSASL